MLSISEERAAAERECSELKAELTALRARLAEAELDAGFKVRQLIATAAVMLVEVDRYWKFNNYQEHTHSWHCKQDCLELCRKMLSDMSDIGQTDYDSLRKSMREVASGNYRPIDQVIDAIAADIHPTASEGDA